MKDTLERHMKDTLERHMKDTLERLHMKDFT